MLGILTVMGTLALLASAIASACMMLAQMTLALSAAVSSDCTRWKPAAKAAVAPPAAETPCRRNRFMLM